MLAFPYPDAPKVLHLTIKKKWFDMILSGDKTEEYREIKEYWNKRLIDREYDFICFRNGYSKDSPVMLVEFLEAWCSKGNTKWGAPQDTAVWILSLGKIKYTRNVL